MEIAELCKSTYDNQLQQSLLYLCDRNVVNTLMLHTHSPNQYSYKVSTSYMLWFPRYSPGKVMVTMGKVRSRSYDVAHIYPSTNVPTVYELSIPQISEI